MQGSFPLTVYDLNVNRVGKNAPSFINIDYDGFFWFSEAVDFSKTDGDVFYYEHNPTNPDESGRLELENNVLYPVHGKGGNMSYRTGFAMAADNMGSKTFMVHQGGGKGTSTNFYLMPGSITKAIESYSGVGGSIVTNRTGVTDSDDIDLIQWDGSTNQYLWGGHLTKDNPADQRAKIGPYTYAVPNGKTVEYLMWADDGFFLDEITVDSEPIASLSDSGQLVYDGNTPFDCDGTEKEIMAGGVKIGTLKASSPYGPYVFKFEPVMANHKIHVTWKPIVAPTGLRSDASPYAMLLFFGLLLGAVPAARRRRKGVDAL